MMIFSSKKCKTLYSGHLLIADTFFRNRRCALSRGLAVFKLTLYATKLTTCVSFSKYGINKTFRKSCAWLAEPIESNRDLITTATLCLIFLFLVLSFDLGQFWPLHCLLEGSQSKSGLRSYKRQQEGLNTFLAFLLLCLKT